MFRPFATVLARRAAGGGDVCVLLFTKLEIQGHSSGCRKLDSDWSISTKYTSGLHHTQTRRHITDTRTRTHARTHARTPVRTYARAHARPPARPFARTHACTHARMRERTHKHTPHTHTQAHTHTRTHTPHKDTYIPLKTVREAF
ncbi:hypothetical protein EVAR_76474_1 [Eumeta japonica]|uniref:Uncharacterized protein n=1 Tax=Eumeta variegata TaxID=151549 RepID=A0A4C1T5F4_EUMVA|nr:hypothetical protein EVAR_76474_1 [Eumeta japonica]